MPKYLLRYSRISLIIADNCSLDPGNSFDPGNGYFDPGNPFDPGNILFGIRELPPSHFLICVFY